LKRKTRLEQKIYFKVAILLPKWPRNPRAMSLAANACSWWDPRACTLGPPLPFDPLSIFCK